MTTAGDKARKVVQKHKDDIISRAQRCLEKMEWKEVQNHTGISQSNRNHYIRGTLSISIEKAMLIIETCKNVTGYEGD